jgi:tRNA threonylcarbamoyladenosine biosynthesis protein TsaE
MKTVVYNNVTEEEVREIAQRIAAGAKAGSVVALTGGLGAGKTVFAKAVAESLGVTETVTSPTFTLIKEYGSGCLPFYHFDVYRIEEPDETEMIGFQEYFFGRGVSVVEWADSIRAFIPDGAVWIDIAYGDEPETRNVTIGSGYAG